MRDTMQCFSKALRFVSQNVVVWQSSSVCHRGRRSAGGFRVRRAVVLRMRSMLSLCVTICYVTSSNGSSPVYIHSEGVDDLVYFALC